MQPSPDEEVTEIHPIILGGDPTDPKNKTVLSRQEHMKAVRFWNKLLKDRRDKEGAS